MVRLMVRPLVTMTLFTEMTEKIIKADLRFTLVIWGSFGGSRIPSDSVELKISSFHQFFQLSGISKKLPRGPLWVAIL